MVLWCVVRPDFRSTRQLPTPSMSTSAQLRLLRDWKEIRSSPPEGCSASPHDESNLFIWGATVFGPDETPWEGGVFSLRLTFTDQYPDRPPRVRFVSDVFHPNGASWLPCAEAFSLLLQSTWTERFAWTRSQTSGHPSTTCARC